MNRPVPILPDAARLELEAIYREVERDTRALGVACWVRGDCCDFERSDHRLYASSVEVAYVRDKHPEAPGGSGPLCPFWKAGRCTERERRPLGCRTYFCDARFRGRLEDLYEASYGRIRDIALRHNIEWFYAPFVDALREGTRT
jgi:hypothetical protein